MKWSRLGLGLGLSARVTSEVNNRGPELAPPLTDLQWTTGLAAGQTVQDSSGLHFVNANSGTLSHDIPGVEDNATYEIIYTLTLRGGGCRMQLYAATTGHLGQTTTRNASGTYTEQVTCNAAGSLALKIRANATGGTAGSNNMDITYLSIRKVLA